MELYMIITYGLLVLWLAFTIYYIGRVWNKGVDNVNPYVYDSIPSVFTTFGILGTFIGIYFGLRDFDVNHVNESIPILLEGLKTAFTTSIFGIGLSFISGKISQVVLRAAQKKNPPTPRDEQATLIEIRDILIDSKGKSIVGLNNIKQAIVGNNKESLASEVLSLKAIVSEIKTTSSKNNENLLSIVNSIGYTDGNLPIVNLLQDGSEKSQQSMKSIGDKIKKISDDVVDNQEVINGKFDEFSQLLAESNTEALVAVMEDATKQFNEQMTSIVEKLVQENFSELNNSVQNMNSWQQENKKMITSLTEQFSAVSKDFTASSLAIKDITENTSKLTDENSLLSSLINELRKVMIEDTKYQEIVGKLTSTVDQIKENTNAFDETTNKLNDWVKKQRDFSTSVGALLVRLEDIDKIKDVNEIFWKETKKQLNEGVSIIANSSKQLSKDVESINEEFYGRLNATFENLDAVMQRVVDNQHN